MFRTISIPPLLLLMVRVLSGLFLFGRNTRGTVRRSRASTDKPANNGSLLAMHTGKLSLCWKSAEPQMRTKKIIALLPKGIRVSNERFSSNTSEDSLELKFEASARQVTLSNDMQMPMQYITVYIELLKVGTIRKVDNAPTPSNNHAVDLLLQGTVRSLASSTAGAGPAVMAVARYYGMPQLTAGM